MLFPRALSLSHRAELSAAPPLPVRSCSRHEASPQLLCSALSKPGDLSCSSHTLPSRPFSISGALLWMLSNSFMSFLYGGDQNRTQHSLCHNTVKAGRNPSVVNGGFPLSRSTDREQTVGEQAPGLTKHGQRFAISDEFLLMSYTESITLKFPTLVTLLFTCSQ